jgi:hypothetical protein
MPTEWGLNRQPRHDHQIPVDDRFPIDAEVLVIGSGCDERLGELA